MNKDKWQWQVKCCSHIRSSQSINDVKMDVLVILIPAQTLAISIQKSWAESFKPRCGPSVQLFSRPQIGPGQGVQPYKLLKPSRI